MLAIYLFLDEYGWFVVNSNNLIMPMSTVVYDQFHKTNHYSSCKCHECPNIVMIKKKIRIQT